jgi:hypothetical protein
VGFLLIVLAIALAVGLFFIVRSTVRYIRYSDASSDPDVGVNPQADYILGRVSAQGSAPAPEPSPAFVDAQIPGGDAPTVAPMQVGTVFGNPGGRHPVTRHDIPDRLRLTLPELFQGLRRDLIDGEEACSIVAAGKASSSDARLDSAARVSSKTPPSLMSGSARKTTRIAKTPAAMSPAMSPPDIENLLLVSGEFTRERKKGGPPKKIGDPPSAYPMGTR